MIYRVRWKDLAVVECDGVRCRKSRVRFPDVDAVVDLFRKHNNLELIRDGYFLMGGFDGEKVVGKRILALPDGTKLCKGFPLFGRNLKVHDEKSNSHWDVLFENPSGGFCYVYSLDKVEESRKKKFEMVDEFEKCLPRLRRNLMKALGESDLVLAMLVLLATRIRVGNEVYYKRTRHKGLTTLKKKDFRIFGDKVLISFVGKDGVPQEVEVGFSGRVLDELRKVLDSRNDGDFVFVREDGGILRDTDFEKGFERFCGVRFYPHIVRSHFATREVERFLLRGGDARKFCLELAGKLGHKKFSKKKDKWENNFAVTLHYYVRPDLVEKISEILNDV